MSYNTAHKLKTAVQTWENEQTKENWDKVLKIGIKHKFKARNRENMYDDTSISFNYSKNLLNRPQLPSEKAMELIEHIRNT
tara:strand:+ start:1329 stop:1571 length:243 start_codon:yes stop_codon:yes gene_type:complete